MTSSTNEPLPLPSPPISPESYNFVLPHSSNLVASIQHTNGRSPVKSTATPLPTPPKRHPSPISSRAFPSYTRSAEPSPTKSTFSALDQSLPPPNFVPRMTGKDFAKPSLGPTKLNQVSPNVTPTATATSRHLSRLPSLAQIQAKMKKLGHRRGSSADGIPVLRSLPRIKAVQRTTSEDSVEVLQTPTDECPPSIRPRIVLAGDLDHQNRRPPTPPSPTVFTAKDQAGLTDFLRQRTSGRLAGTGTSAATRARPLSMPPLRGGVSIPGLTDRPARPVLKVTPPTLEQQRACPPPRCSTPPASIVLNTPPSQYSSRALRNVSRTTPPSPTGSVGSSFSSMASPTLSVPIITCTPAPSRVKSNDGVEYDSDEGEDDVILFEGETMDNDKESVTSVTDSQSDERERRGKEMLSRLNLRRQSS